MTVIGRVDVILGAVTAGFTKGMSKSKREMKALGKSCGGCHKPFRKPKEESFKNKARSHDHDAHK